jgi:hypothetical protein
MHALPARLDRSTRYLPVRLFAPKIASRVESPSPASALPSPATGTVAAPGKGLVSPFFRPGHLRPIATPMGQACWPLLVKLDVIGKLVTLSEREAGELRDVAAADAGRSTTRRDLSLLLERGLRTKTTVALSRAEARDLAELLTRGGFGSNLALLREALLSALEDSPQ